MTKSKFKALFISILLAAVAVCLSVGLAACKGGDKDGGKYGVGEEGVYYYDKDSSTEYLMILQSGNYMISAEGAKSYSGTYSYKEDSKSVSFKTDGGESFDATFSDDVMQLAIEGTPYTFLKRVSYTVTFVDGNSKETSSVVYGRKAVAPEKDESRIFIGWYEDSSFTTPYKFDTAVTGDLTLYAYYIDIDSTIANYEVSFVDGGETVYTTETQNGIVYDIPEYDGILGWWVSDTNDGDALTYKYEGQTLTEATKLFAVEERSLGASVYEDKITWEATVSSVSVTVDGANVVTSYSSNDKSFPYDITNLGTGVHYIVVTGGSYSEELVYVVNGLSRVSNFGVYGNVLVYNAVENAQYYYISVSCGNPSHDHEMVYNGNTLTYDFSNCEMGPDGITFTVYAYGAGYMESVSETFVYALILDETAVSIDAASDTATWAPVENSTGYEVYVNGELVATLTATEYSLKYYGMGTVSVSVKPVAPGYYSEASEAVLYQKATLPAPEITGIDEYTVSWSEVSDATNYIIYVNGKQIETVSCDITSYALAGDADFVKADSYVITIKATNSGNTNQNSQESDPVYATDDTMSPLLVYGDGVVYWQYAMAVGTYYVSINDEDETEVYGKNSFDVTFTQSGGNVIKVYFKTDSGNSAVASLNVTTYAVIFDTRGGDTIDTMYVAKGDTLKLVTPTYGDAEAEFSGWYTLPDLSGDYDADTYLGDGYIVRDGSVFNGDSTFILYAGWLSVKYVVNLETSIGVVYDADGNVTESVRVAKDSTTFTISVPYNEDITYIFLGWYTEENGRGTRYTDGNGKAVRSYDISGATTLYAFWAKTVDFGLTMSGRKDVLSAKAGSGIAYVTEVTIPATYVYDGTEYDVAVIGASAFNDCANLVTINIPDTIENISITDDGYRSGTGAFAGCGNLKNVNIYATANEPDSTLEFSYYSEDGVLFYKNSFTGYVEIVYYPQGRTEEVYTIPSSVSNDNECDAFGEPVTRLVQSIATQVFRGKAPTEYVIPTSVVNVDTQAFYYSNAKKITFLEGEGDALTLATYAFRTCEFLTEITLPGRVKTFNVNVFYNCNVLHDIYIAGSSSNYSSIDGVLANASGNTLIYYPKGRSGAYTIPAGVVTVGADAFNGCGSLTSVTIPAYVTRICESAFYDCNSLATIDFQGTSNSQKLAIETLAFYSCDVLRSVTLPKNLTELGKYAFGNCRYLTTVTYDSFEGATSDDLSGLEAYAFSTSGSTSANSYVTTLNLGANVPEIPFMTIFGGAGLSTVNIDANNQNLSIADGVVFGGGGTTIYYFPSSFSGTYEIPGTVETITEGTFGAANGLTGIVIPASVTTIATNAFLNCASLVTVTFEKSSDGAEAAELTICNSAFSGCTGLVAIELPARLSSLGTGVFNNCTGLEDVTVEEGNAYYTASYGVLYEAENGTATKLIYCPVNNKYTNVVLLSTITSIESGAFSGNATVEEISFDGEVGSSFTLGDGIFSGCKNLKKVTLPEGLTSISTGMFQSCTSLTEIVIPSTVTTVGIAAFYGCTALSAVTFAGEDERTAENKLTFTDGSGTSASNSGVFYNCTNLTSINLPAYTVVGAYMFRGCSSLVSVTIPEGTTAIPTYAFYQCTSLTKVEGGDSLTSIGNHAFYGCTALAQFDIPGTVTTLGTNVFYNDTALTSITIPEGVTELDTNVFYNTGITTLNIPKNLESIATTSLRKNAYLTTITVDCENTHFAVIDNVLYGLTNGVPTDLWLDPICNSVTTLTVPATVTTVQQYAFESSNIVSIVFEDYDENGQSYNLTFTATSSSQIFDSANYIASMTLPEGMTSLPDYAFTKVTSLKEIVIPSTMTSIGARAFTGCTSLETITFTEGGTSLSFSDGSHQSSVSSSYGAFCRCTALTEITLPARTTNISSSMFEGCTNLETIDIGSTQIAKIGSYAFNRCGVTSMTLPSTVTEIGTYAYYETDISSVTLNEGLLTIGQYALSKCGSLATMSIPSTVTTIDSYAFQSTPLTTLEFGAGGTADLTFNTYAFSEMTTLTAVTLPARLVTIGSYSFIRDTALAEVTFEDGSRLKKIDTQAFAYTGLTSFSIPQSTNKIELTGANTGGIFVGCDSLTYFTVSSSEITGLGLALAKCTSITQLVIDSNSTSYMLNGSYPVVYTYGEADRALEYVFGTLTGEYTVMTGTKSIGEYAFQNQVQLTGVVIPSSMTSIERYAFTECTSLKEVTFEAGANIEFGNYVFNKCTALETIDLGRVVTYGTYVFSGCTSLSSVTLSVSSEFTEMGIYMFQGCTSLKSIDIPDNVTFISRNCFNGAGLESVTIPESVTWLPYASNSTGVGTTAANTFYGCESLEVVVLSSTITAIGIGVFQNCSSLKVITYTGDPDYDPEADYSETGYCAFPEGLEIIGKQAFSGCGLIEVQVPVIASSSLGDNAFEKNLSLKTVTAGDSAVIGTSMFDGCTALETVTIGTGVTVGNKAFNGCTSIKTVSVGGNTSIGESVFASCSSLETVQLGMGVTIGKEAFKSCTKLSSINLEGVTTLGANVFDGCSALTTVDVSGVTSMGSKVFLNCTSLDSVTWNETAGLAVPEYTFQNCSALTELEGFSTVTFIFSYAFDGCSSLSDYGVFAAAEQIGSYTFRGCSFESVALPATANSLNDHAFQNCVNLRSAVLSDILTSVPEYLFAGCTSLAYVNIPVAATSIGQYAFQNCGLVTNLDISGVKTIGAGAFDGCSSLVGAELNSSLTSIGNYTFRNCSKLLDVDIPNGVTSIGSSAFYGCSSLEKITVPSSVTTLSASCFQGCTNLESVDLLGGITTLSESAFAGCVSLISITIPDTVTTIGTSCFEGCTSLETVTFGGGVTTINANAFSGCTSIEALYIPSSVTSVGSSAFSGWTEEQTIYVDAAGDEVTWTSGWDTGCEANVVYASDDADVGGDENPSDVDDGV